MVGITVVCYKRKRSKQCTEQEDGNYSIAGEKSLQRPPTSIPELEGQDNRDPNTKGTQGDKQVTQDHYYSIPFNDQLKIQNQVKIPHILHQLE